VYEYALVDRTGKMDLSQLRALQDWFLKYELKTVANVSEVATVGGMVRQYQIVLDPNKLRGYNIAHGKVIEAIQKANQETGGSVLELGEAEYMVRASGYLQSLDDFRKIPLTATAAGIPVRGGDVARVTDRTGNATRTGRTRRSRRSRRRCHRHAFRQERTRNDRGSKSEAGRIETRFAAWR
jgi:Cu(I)/Ag(I) efflux system membrane protein CusA/SilA